MKFNKIEQQTHYGKVVWTHTEMNELRRDECLCRHCKKVGPCEIGKALFEICQSKGVALSVTRCPEWEKSETKMIN